MADNLKVNMGEGSPEYVAYKLLLDIAAAENGLRDRKTILDTYAECLDATRGARSYPKQKP